MKKDISQTDLPSGAGEQAQPAMPTGVASGKHIRTEGEKKFDRLTYSTVGYVINALLSVVAVYAIERTHRGQQWMERFVAKAQGVLPLDRRTSKMLATKSFFLTGGFAVLLPMKWLEDAKVRLVKKWDHAIYGEKAETDPQIVQSHRELEAAPKQTWASIFSSRVLALVPFYATVGLLWDRTSLLSRATNPALKENLARVSSEAQEAYFASNPEAGRGWFDRLRNNSLREARGEAIDHYVSQHAKEAGKGTYFDRPIAWVSRKIGTLASHITGDTVARTRIAEMEKNYPGMVKHDAHGSLNQDPNHSVVPYYFISESITSGMVAWGVYALTRVMAPIAGKKHAKPEATTVVASASPEPVVAARATAPEEASVPTKKEAKETAEHPPTHPANNVERNDNPTKKPHHTPHAPTPDSRVHVAGLEHQQAHEPQASTHVH